MGYETVLFDLDGTLLDTLEDLNLSMQHALGKFDLPICTLEQTRDCVGNGVDRFVELSLPKEHSAELFNKVRSEFVSYYGEHANDHTCPYPGITELLNCLRSEGHSLVVISNKGHDPVCDLIKLHFGDVFDSVVGVQEGIRRKPARDMIDFAIQQINSDASEGFVSNQMVYVGDSEVDILTASNANLPCISVSWGFRDAEYLKRAGATYVVNSVKELYEAIAKSG